MSTCRGTLRRVQRSLVRRAGKVGSSQRTLRDLIAHRFAGILPPANTAWLFERMLSANAVTVLQSDATRCGVSGFIHTAPCAPYLDASCSLTTGCGNMDALIGAQRETKEKAMAKRVSDRIVERLTWSLLWGESDRGRVLIRWRGILSHQSHSPQRLKIIYKNVTHRVIECYIKAIPDAIGSSD